MPTCEYCGDKAGERYRLALEWPAEKPRADEPVTFDNPGAGELRVCGDCADAVVDRCFGGGSAAPAHPRSKVGRADVATVGSRPDQLDRPVLADDGLGRPRKRRRIAAVLGDRLDGAALEERLGVVRREVDDTALLELVVATVDTEDLVDVLKDLDTLPIDVIARHG